MQSRLAGERRWPSPGAKQQRRLTREKTVAGEAAVEPRLLLQTARPGHGPHRVLLGPAAPPVRPPAEGRAAAEVATPSSSHRQGEQQRRFPLPVQSAVAL